MQWICSNIYTLVDQNAIRILLARSNCVYISYIYWALLLFMFPDSGNPCLFSDTDIGKKKKDIILLVRVWN